MLTKCLFCSLSDKYSLLNNRIIKVHRSYVLLLVLEPESFGHFIVIPKKHYSDFSQLGSVANKLFSITLNNAQLITKLLDAPAFTIKINNNLYKLERSNPMHVGHVHMHVIPRYRVNKSFNAFKSEDEIIKLAKRISKLF